MNTDNFYQFRTEDEAQNSIRSLRRMGYTVRRVPLVDNASQWKWRVYYWRPGTPSQGRPHLRLADFF